MVVETFGIINFLVTIKYTWPTAMSQYLSPNRCHPDRGPSAIRRGQELVTDINPQQFCTYGIKEIHKFVYIFTS